MTSPNARATKRGCVSPMQRLILVAIAAMALFSWSGCALFGLDDGWDLPITAKKTITLPIDLSTLPTSGQTAPQRLEIPLPLDALPVDLSNVNQDMADNKDKLKSVEITQITLQPTTNTLTADLPPIQLYIGPEGSTTAADGVLVATIPSVPAGTTQAIGGVVDDAGMAAAQPYITSLTFAFVPQATLVVEAGQNVPGGAAILEVTLAITATVDPTK